MEVAASHAALLLAEMGIAVVATDTPFSVSFEDDAMSPADPYEMLSLASLRKSFYTTLQRRLHLIIQECRRLSVDGVLDRFHIGCRSVAGDALIFKEAITRELGIPVLLLERDDFDPRVYDHEQYRRKLEIFKTMLGERSKPGYFAL